MTKEDWLNRLEVVEEDLAVAEKSRTRHKELDCVALRGYVQWIKVKAAKASMKESPPCRNNTLTQT